MMLRDGKPQPVPSPTALVVKNGSRRRAPTCFPRLHTYAVVQYGAVWPRPVPISRGYCPPSLPCPRDTACKALLSMFMNTWFNLPGKHSRPHRVEIQLNLHAVFELWAEDVQGAADTIVHINGLQVAPSNRLNERSPDPSRPSGWRLPPYCAGMSCTSAMVSSRPSFCSGRPHSAAPFARWAPAPPTGRDMLALPTAVCCYGCS